MAEAASEFFAVAGDDPFFLMVNYADAHLPLASKMQGVNFMKRLLQDSFIEANTVRNWLRSVEGDVDA